MSDMVKSTSLQHIGILVPDAEKAAKWYCEKSDFERRAEFMSQGSQVVFVYSRATGALCELIQRPAGSKEAADIEKNGARIDHIAYEVEDLELEFAHAKEAGMDIIEGIVDIPEFWDNGFRYFLVRGAGGEKVEYCRVV